MRQLGRDRLCRGSYACHDVIASHHRRINILLSLTSDPSGGLVRPDKGPRDESVQARAISDLGPSETQRAWKAAAGPGSIAYAGTRCRQWPSCIPLRDFPKLCIRRKAPVPRSGEQWAPMRAAGIHVAPNQRQPPGSSTRSASLRKYLFTVFTFSISGLRSSLRMRNLESADRQPRASPSDPTSGSFALSRPSKPLFLAGVRLIGERLATCLALYAADQTGARRRASASARRCRPGRDSELRRTYSWRR